MSNATMSISSFLKVSTRLPVETSVLLRGDHGIGKSQLARKVAKLRAQKEFDGIERPVIDIRLSQMTDGDMLGLPSTDGNTTRWNPMDWYKTACTTPVVLLLDEINRANTEIMQASFQIVLDRELAGMKLHPQTIVISAINTSAVYTVNEVDPALLDRFFVVDLVPTVKDWISWAREKNDVSNRQNIHDYIIDFISKNENCLDTPRDGEPTDVHPSRRSWERISNALVDADLIDEPDVNEFYTMCVGFLGREIAIKFRDFVKKIDRQVSAEEIINKYHLKSVQKKLRGPNLDRELTQDQMNDLIDKVSHNIISNNKLLSDKQCKNITAFVKDLPNELRIKFWSDTTSSNIENIELIKLIHKHVCHLIMEAFGVECGDEGMNVQPTIPSMFDNKD